MNIKPKLEEIGLTPDNAIIIGSGILNVLHLREIKDIDVIVTEEKYKDLSGDNRFKKAENHGKEVLTDGLLEIGTSWTVIAKTWKFKDLLEYSTIINGCRFNNIQFLLSVKKSWLTDEDVRQKDIDDIKLMEIYLSRAR